MARDSAKKILINGNTKEELRVALVERGKLFSLEIESKGKEQKKSNIYKGTISRIEPSLEAVFVNWGSDRHGFLPFREIAKEYANSPTPIDFSRQNIKDFVFEGQEIIVQVDKEERGTKGAALTTFLTLAGCYLVLMPNNPRAGGISKRIEGDERAELREALSALNVPEGMGVIIRTAGVGKSIEELQWDLNVLLTQFDAIQNAANAKAAPFLIFQEGNAVIRAIRDYLKPDIDEIIIDDIDIYNDIRTYIQMIRPEFTDKTKHYSDKIPIFSRYQIESQIETAFKREIQLPAGGAIVIDHTEALISIDINSAKATKGLDIEETALQTNLEAAEEIARQLRLRDLGGLIVIDFIDMNVTNNQRAVEDRLRNSLSLDKAKVQIGRISRFGLLEMSRQRLRPTLAESNQISCPRCSGHGTIHSIETLAVIVSRVIEEEAIKENTAQIYIEAPLDLSAYLINEKRSTINIVEEKHGVKVILIPNPNLSTPQYLVKRIKHDEIQKQSQETQIASYTLVPAKEIVDEKAFFAEEIEKTPAAAVQFTMTASPPPPPAKKAVDRAEARDEKGEAKQKSTSIIKKIWSSLIGENASSTDTEAVAKENLDAPPKYSRPNYNQDRYQPRHKKRYSSQDRDNRDRGGRQNYGNRPQANINRRDDNRPNRDDRYGHTRDENRPVREDNRPIRDDNRHHREDNRHVRDDRRGAHDERRGMRNDRHGEMRDNRERRDNRPPRDDNFAPRRQDAFVENPNPGHAGHTEHFAERGENKFVPIEQNDNFGNVGGGTRQAPPAHHQHEHGGHGHNHHGQGTTTGVPHPEHNPTAPYQDAPGGHGHQQPHQGQGGRPPRSQHKSYNQRGPNRQRQHHQQRHSHQHGQHSQHGHNPNNPNSSGDKQKDEPIEINLS